MINQLLLSLRKKNQFTQEYVAEVVGTTRQTYSLLEKGEQELSLSEANALSKLYGISIDDLFLGNDSTPTVTIVKNQQPSPHSPSQPFRISVPQKNIEKFKEILLYILTKIGAKPNVGETVLYKLLYFIDFDYYEKHEEQLIGATYIKNHYGPTPVEFQLVIEDMIEKKELVKVDSKYFNKNQKKYLPIREPDLTVLKNARELQHIDDVLARLSDKNASELSEYSHQDVPWIVTEMGKEIQYEYVFYRTDPYSVRQYDEL